MLIRRQDLSVLLFYYLGYSKIRNFILHLQHKPVARFVIFHDISPEALGCFKANLHFLKQSMNVVSLDDFFYQSQSKTDTVFLCSVERNEQVGNAFPFSVESIANALKQTLQTEPAADFQSRAKQHVENHSWHQTADIIKHLVL